MERVSWKPPAGFLARSDQVRHLDSSDPPPSLFLWPVNRPVIHACEPGAQAADNPSRDSAFHGTGPGGACDCFCDFRISQADVDNRGPGRRRSDRGPERFHRVVPWVVRTDGPQRNPRRGLGGNQRRTRRSDGSDCALHHPGSRKVGSAVPLEPRRCKADSSRQGFISSGRNPAGPSRRWPKENRPGSNAGPVDPTTQPVPSTLKSAATNYTRSGAATQKSHHKDTKIHHVLAYVNLRVFVVET